MTPPERPLPVAQPESDRYWEGVRNEELWLQRDTGTGQYQFYPRGINTISPGDSLEWVRASGNATLFTFAIVHAPPHPAFAQDVPYITAIVELEEGPKMPANLVGVDPDPANLEIGMPLKVVFTKVNEECTLPNFAPA